MVSEPPGEPPGAPRPTVVCLDLVSHVAAARPRVWAAVASMSGVNAELAPLVRMTAPRGVDRIDGDDARVREGFTSWILLLGLVPLDRHRFGFERIVDGHRFDERSRSWLQRSWRHTRTVTDGPSGASAYVRDELAIEPRLALLAPVVRVAVRGLFRHRHARLRRRFGGA